MDRGGEMRYEEMVRGAIVGHIVGDALGVPYEFKRARDLPPEITWTGQGSHMQPAGTWSDDGALMLCALASLVEQGGFDPEDMGRRFVAWFDEGYMAAGGVVFDYGRSTRAAISRLRDGVPALQAGGSDETDNGNGSLMRIIPLSLWTCAASVEEQVSLSHDCSRITHAHPRSQVCCALYGLLVRRMLAADSPDLSWDEACVELREVYKSNSEWSADFARELDCVEGYTGVCGSGYVVDCLRSAWLALFGGSDYASCVRAAVRMGNDADTTACVAGGLAGIMYGAGSIPDEWRDGLRLDSGQKALVDRFAKSCPRPAC